MEAYTVVFMSGTISAAVLLALMALSGYYSGFRFWPPGSRNGKWAIYWILATINTVSIILLLILEFDSFKLSLTSISSLAAIIGGLVVTMAAIKQLGLEKTSGIKDKFYSEGLYRYSRNPQVLGNLISLIGAAALLQNLPTLVLCILTGSWLVTMVFSEEKWLSQEYGEEYDKYRESTPRFI